MIQRTIRELSQLGYFDQQQIGVNPVPDPLLEPWTWNIQSLKGLPLNWNFKAVGVPAE